MKYFVFDLGGVLSVPMVSKKLYEQIEWKVSYDEFLDKFNNSAESIKVHKGEISTKEFFEYLKRYMNDNITLEEFKNIYVNNNEFFNDTIETIKKLKNLGYKVYLLSVNQYTSIHFFAGIGFDHTVSPSESTTDISPPAYSSVNELPFSSISSAI